MVMVKEAIQWSTGLQELKSYKTLQNLANHPFDLTQPNALSQDRIRSFRGAGAGYQLFYATERVTQEVMQALYNLAIEAQVFEKIEAMQSGEILNFIEGYPSDHRAVLHTALRDFFENPRPQTKAQRELAKKELDKLQQFIRNIDKENRFTDLIFIAIGGSELGPEATYLACEHLKHFRHAHFISNVDPDEAHLVLDQVNLEKCLVVVVSKSGTTQETQTNEALARARFQKEGLDTKSHFLSITTPGTPMDDPKRYLETFYIWDWVGGRFSTSSMVGGLLLSFVYGFDIYQEFLRGAHAMDQAALNRNLNENPPLLSALLGIWNRNFLNYPTTAVIPYSSSLRRYAAHIQQVDMESNGKQVDRMGRKLHTKSGPIIWGEPGNNAQHSFFQLLHQGTDIVPLEMIGFKESQTMGDMNVDGSTSQQKLLANLFAQTIALAQGQKNENPNKIFPGNRPSHILFGKRLTPALLGGLLAFYEHKIAFQGFIWNINSFDQEGVQLGKELANRILKKDPSFQVAQAYIQLLDEI